MNLLVESQIVMERYLSLLPNSRFIVNYSTRYYKLIEDDTILALYPDINIQESISDYY